MSRLTSALRRVFPIPVPGELLYPKPTPGAPTVEQKPILCLDFDGVLHSYKSGWQGADHIPDPPVPGAMKFLADAVKCFDVQIFSSRSGTPMRVPAMQHWLFHELVKEFQGGAFDIFDKVKWPKAKPPAMVTIDDRAITFRGNWPSMDTLLNFKPWRCP